MIKFLLDPLVIFCLLLILSSVFLLRKKRKWSRITLGAAIIWFLVCSTPFLPHALLGAWESQYPRQADLSRIPAGQKPAILVLGAGHTQEDALAPNDQLSRTSLQRLIEGVRIYRKLGGTQIIFSGYAGAGKISHAAIMKNAALDLGVNASDIRLLESPTNTREETEAYKKISDPSDPLILVTSASHMPRAMYLFQVCGIHPIPAPTAHLVKYGPKPLLNRWGISLENMNKMKTFISERVGLWHSQLFYRCR